MAGQTNLQILKPSRVPPKEGDVFTFRMPDGLHRFGRVINTKADVGIGKPQWVLIYLYRGTYDNPAMPSRADLRRDALLVAPEITNRLPWSRGYFETVGNLPLEDGDVLRQHCFEKYDGRYFDEAGHQLGRRSEPCGSFGVGSYRSIDDQLSKALGIPLAPD
jgi:hypothetical protein